MKVTIKEIAERAGVHRATVDKVLHNRVGVSDEVRMKVQRIIKEMGYTPNPAGRVLQKQGKKNPEQRMGSRLTRCRSSRPALKKGIHNQVGFDIEVTYSISKFQDAERQKEFIDNAIAARATASSSARSIPSASERRSTERWIPGYRSLPPTPISTGQSEPAASASTTARPPALQAV